MPTISELRVLSGAPLSSLHILRKYGLDFEDDDFDIDKHHQKALYELHRKRMCPYVIAYALRCSARDYDDGHNRYHNIESISELRGLDLADAISDVRRKHIEAESLPQAQYWIDRAAGEGRDMDAFERLSDWCQFVLKSGPSWEVDHTYLAVRLLMSLPCEEMIKYPKPIQSALNRTRHHGFLDGWHRTGKDEEGKNKTYYFRPGYDL